MNKTQPQKTLLNLSILAILYGVLPSNAMAADKSEMVTKTKQTAETKLDKKQANEEGIEVITVSGTRASLKRALNAKRFSDQVMDGISAEDMGKLPDNNIAESLSRISGISMSRADGEGEFVSVRGMAPNLNKVTLNGQSMSSSGNGNVSPGTLGGGRGFDMNLIGSEMVSAVEVFKSPAANMQEGALGGTINLKTRTPLQSGNALSINVKGTHDTTADKSGVGVSTFFSKVNEDETFGVTGSINYYDRTTQRNSMESRGWSKQTSAPYSEASGYTEEGVYRIEDIRSNFRRDERERVGANLTFQWLLGEDTDIKIETLYSQQDREFISTNWDVDFRDSDFQIVDPASIVIDSGNVVKQTVTGSTKNRTSFDNSGFHRFYDDELSSINLTLTHNAGDWTFTPAIGISESTSVIDWSNPAFGSSVFPVSYDYPNGSYSPTVTFDANDQNLKPENMFLEALNYRHMQVDESKIFAQFDADLDLDNDTFSSLEFGVRYSTTDREREYGHDNIKNAVKAENGGTFPAFTNYAILHTDSDMLSEAPVSSWYMPDFDKINEDFGHLVPEELTARAWEQWELEETISAAYVQANIDTEWGDIKVRGNIGVRAVETSLDISSFKLLPGQGAEPVSADTSYTDILPSINLNFTVRDDLIIRTAVAKVMARPNYDKLSPVLRQTGSSTNATFITGDPELDPFRANQYDLSIEWYFNDEGLLSAGLFYKDIESFITTTTTQVPLAEVADLLTDLDPEDITNIQDQTIAVRSSVNGFGATVQGLELSYQQAFENGLGFVLNYTYNDSDTDLINPDTGETTSLPGLSQDNYNAIVYYEKNGFNARLAYNYRSSYFDIFSFSGEAHFIDDFGQIDLGLGYDINKQMSVNFDATNLGDEKSYEYVGNNSRGYAVRDNGRRYSVSFKYKF